MSICDLGLRVARKWTPSEVSFILDKPHGQANLWKYDKVFTPIVAADFFDSLSVATGGQLLRIDKQCSVYIMFL